METPNKVFQDGGKLKEDAFYIKRKADDLLYEYLLNGDYCSILDPRQVGKSSLMERTSQRLAAAGVKCGYIDMQSLASSEVTFDKLINSLLFTVCRGLGIKNDTLAFLKEYTVLSPNKVLELFFREVVFPAIDAENPPGTRIVLFVDEVDIVKSFKNVSASADPNEDKSSIGDDFFLTFRSLHEFRIAPPFDRLAVCFAGVAFTGDLVSRPEISPFNVGKRVILSDFTRAEMAEFGGGLGAFGGGSEALIDAVYDWTSGHPYMSQKVLLDLSKHDADGRGVRALVEERINQLFLLPNISPDANLAYALKRLTSPNETEEAKKRRPQILETFWRVKKAADKKIRLEKNLTDTPSYDESRLIGLMSFVNEPDGNYLKIRNRIYDIFFSDEWVVNLISEQREFRPFFEKWIKHGKADDYLLRGEALESALAWAVGREDVTVEEREFIDKSQKFNQQQLLTLAEARRANWYRTAVSLAFVVVVVAFGLFGYASFQRMEAVNQADLAVKKGAEAEQQRRLAENKQQLAEEKTELAVRKGAETEEQRKIADERRLEAQKQTKIAEAKTEEARKQKDIADSERNDARKQKEIADNERNDARKQKEIADERTAEALAARENLELEKQKVEAAKREGELLAEIKLRQERATQTIYTEEQKAVFRKDAANLATEIAALGSNRNVNLGSVLPKSFAEFSDQPKNVDNLPDKRFEDYAGALAGSGQPSNYLVELGNFDYSTPAEERYFVFRDQRNPEPGRKIALPQILNLDYTYSESSLFTPSGDFWIKRINDVGLYYDREKGTFNAFGSPEVERLDGLEAVFQSKANPKKIGLVGLDYSSDFDGTRQQTMLLFDKETGVSRSLRGFFFVKTSDENVVFQDNRGFQQANLLTGEVSPLSVKTTSEPVSGARQMMVPVYDPASRNLAVVRFIFGAERDALKARINVFNLAAMKQVVSDYEIVGWNSPYLGALMRNHLYNLFLFSPDGKYLLIQDTKWDDGRIYKTDLKILDVADFDRNDKAKTIRFDRFIGYLFFLTGGNRLGVWEAPRGGDENPNDTLKIFDWKDLLAARDNTDDSRLASQKADIAGNLTNPFYALRVFYPAENEDFIVFGDRTGAVKAASLKNFPRLDVAEVDKLTTSVIGVEIDGRDLILNMMGGVYSRLAYGEDGFRIMEKFDLKDISINSAASIRVSPKFDQFANFSGREVRLWNSDRPDENTRKLTLAGTVKAIEYSPDGENLLITGDWYAALWNVAADKKIDLVKTPSVDSKIGQIKFAGFSNSGRTLLVEFRNGYLLYDTKSAAPAPAPVLFWEDNDVKNDPSIYLNYNYADNYIGAINKLLASPPRFSPDDKLFVAAGELNQKDGLVDAIFGAGLGDYLKLNSFRNIVRIIEAGTGEIRREFIIDGFKSAKFSRDGRMVAMFTTTGQCFIAPTGKFDSDEALLLPLEGVASGDFSPSGEKFVTVVNDNNRRNKTIYIFDTSISEKSKSVNGAIVGKGTLPLPADAYTRSRAIANSQEIYFVRFSDETEIEIGRGVTYSISKPVDNSKTQSLPVNANTGGANVRYSDSLANGSLRVSTVKTRVSDQPQAEKETRSDCYKVNADGMLAAKSRCGK